MKQMMEGLGANMGMLGKMPGMKNVAMAKQLRKQMAQGGGMPGMGFPGMPGMGFPGMGMPGMGLPGMGMPGMPGMGMPGGGAGDSMTRMRPLSASEKNARKAARKREKEARRKSRR
jgi:signal recognition particle subunit SRP54